MRPPPPLPLPSFCPQVGFFNFVAVPCFEALVETFPRLAPVKEQVLRNLAHWVALEKQRLEEAHQSDHRVSAHNIAPGMAVLTVPPACMTRD